MSRHFPERKTPSRRAAIAPASKPERVPGRLCQLQGCSFARSLDFTIRSNRLTVLTPKSIDRFKYLNIYIYRSHLAWRWLMAHSADQSSNLKSRPAKSARPLQVKLANSFGNGAPESCSVNATYVKG